MSEPMGPAPAVLVVEDDDVVRGILATVLEEEGYRVLCAANGADALQCLAAPGAPVPALILVDMWMPVMNGRQFIHTYRQAFPPTPIVALTGAFFTSSLDETPAVDELVTKPFDVDSLLAVVQRYAAPSRPLVPA